MTFAFFQHEAEHGPPVVPGPLPPNAGEIVRYGVPGWVVPHERSLDRSAYIDVWQHLRHHGQITDEESRALFGVAAVHILQGLANRSGGVIARRGPFWVLVAP